MPLNDVIINKGQGGLGRALPGEDYISGMIFYTGTLPSGFSSTDRIKNIFSVEQAEGLGIVADYSDETRATGTYLVTNAGAANDTVLITVLEYPTTDNPTGLVSFGTYTRPTASTTVGAVATDLAALINAGTATHGYTASVNTATVTITARAGLGTFLNTGTPIVVTISGTIAGTLTQFSSGVASLKANWHYHISEFFRLNPSGNMYLGMHAVPGTYDFAEVATVQAYANGKIRQFAVWADNTTYTSGKVQAAQAIATSLEAAHMPCSILLTFNYAAATLSSMADLATLNSKNVSIVLSQDGAALGYRLYKALGRSITNIGAVLGLVSASKVSECIAWIGKFNISDGNENDVAAFANGALVSAQAKSLLDTLNTQRYLFNIKKVGYAGTFMNDSHCCVTFASDYAYIENNRTIDKAGRNLYAGYLPLLNSPGDLSSNGELTDTAVAVLEGVGETALDQMVRDAELSDKAVIVDPAQDVLQTSKLVVAASLLAKGVFRNIEVNIKYVLSL